MLRQNVDPITFRVIIGFAFFAAVLFLLIPTNMARKADGAAQDSISRPEKEICTLEARQYVRILLRYYSNHPIDARRKRMAIAALLSRVRFARRMEIDLC
jgi:hypothetical protein